MIDYRKDIARAIVRKYGLKPSFEAMERLAEMLEPTKLRYRVTFISPGEMVDKFFYIEKGFVRVYNGEGDKAVTTALLHEGDMLVCDDSLFGHEPTQSYASTVEPTILYSMRYSTLFMRAAQYPELMHLLLSIMEGVINSKNEYTRMMRLPTSKRYDAMAVNNPEAYRRASQKHIASYLQMAPETLSRIRSQKLSE